MDRRNGFNLCISILLPLPMALAQTGPTFTAPRIMIAAFSVGADVGAADLNGDGVSDLIQANPGPAFGPNLLTFRAKLLENDGSELANAGGAPPAGPAASNCAVRVAAGDFDEDGRADLVALTYGLGVNLARNTGQAQSISGFGPSTLVDDLGRQFSYAFPVALHLPVFLVEDLDHDGHQDLLLAPLLVDYWGQHMTSPGVFVYFGRGDGTFDPVLQSPLPSTPIDGDWVDWDGNGIAETLVVLGQYVPTALQNQPDVARFRFTGRALQQLGSTQAIPAPAFATSLTYVARQPGMGNRGAYFVAGHDIPFPWIMRPELHAIDVDAQGSLGGATPIPLPAAMTGGSLGDLQGIQAADFDGDGAVDLVAVHACGIGAAGSLLWVMGPLDAFGSHSGTFLTGLGGAIVETRNGPPSTGPGILPVWVPNLSSPSMLALTDLNLDQLPDVLVGGLMVQGPTSWHMASAALLNLAQPGGWRGSVQHVAPARPSPAGILARAGTRGGLPVVGNAAFGITLADAPRDAVIGLVGGTLNAVFTWNGLPMAHVPDHFSALQTVHAGIEGGSRAAHAVPIPNHAALLGMQTFFQWMIHDLNATDPFPIYCSDTLLVEVGQQL
jgi:hypothetical protein